MAMLKAIIAEMMHKANYKPYNKKVYDGTCWSHGVF